MIHLFKTQLDVSQTLKELRDYTWDVKLDKHIRKASKLHSIGLSPSITSIIFKLVTLCFILVAIQLRCRKMMIKMWIQILHKASQKL